ncbi:hypothetical protein AV521_04955 [Streptomyces sp. IMTB 2501]|uniref:hypothetical protein n=1 Tax=Streptomyces sp. IMTB 2501 TaxID=1776340 RepID=UPI00096FE09C|nr:hypothetical protein [Streptomyces sp. IMTB 2501]OLZ73422.1 hypothetical protein AV521_04955 [Streptomyces sp. IMTB 2501]
MYTNPSVSHDRFPLRPRGLTLYTRQVAVPTRGIIVQPDVPSDGTRRELIPAYIDLAESDECVTTVVRYMEGGIFEPAPVEDLLACLRRALWRV